MIEIIKKALLFLAGFSGFSPCIVIEIMILRVKTRSPPIAPTQLHNQVRFYPHLQDQKRSNHCLTSGI